MHTLLDKMSKGCHQFPNKEETWSRLSKNTLHICYSFYYISPLIYPDAKLAKISIILFHCYKVSSRGISHAVVTSPLLQTPPYSRLSLGTA